MRSAAIILTTTAMLPSVAVAAEQPWRLDSVLRLCETWHGDFDAMLELTSHARFDLILDVKRVYHTRGPAVPSTPGMLAALRWHSPKVRLSKSISGFGSAERIRTLPSYKDFKPSAVAQSREKVDLEGWNVDLAGNWTEGEVFATYEFASAYPPYNTLKLSRGTAGTVRSHSCSVTAYSFPEGMVEALSKWAFDANIHSAGWSELQIGGALNPSDIPDQTSAQAGWNFTYWPKRLLPQDLNICIEKPAIFISSSIWKVN